VFTVRTASGQPVMNSEGEAIAIQKSTLTGNPLIGRGTVLSGNPSQLQEGMVLQERIVGLPANPELVVGVDPSLDEVAAEAIAALESALQSTTETGETVQRIRPVRVDPQTSVDFVLAQVTDELRRQVDPVSLGDLPGNGAIALFSPTLAFISRTDGSSGESVTAAVNRLIPRFKTLLAAKVLRAIADTSSDLQISGEVFASNRATTGPRVSITSRAIDAAGGGDRQSAATELFTDGDVMQLQLNNQDNQALYVSCLLVNARGEIDVLHPARWDAPEEASRIATGESIVIPRAEDEVQVTLRGSGFLEMITLVSTEPLRNALRGLQTIARGQGRDRGGVRASDGEPIQLIDSLLGDVDQASRSVEADFEVTSTRTRAVNSRAIAAFTTVIEVRS